MFTFQVWDGVSGTIYDADGNPFMDVSIEDTDDVCSEDDAVILIDKLQTVVDALNKA